MAVIGGGLGVVENSLVRDADIKDLLQDEGSFSGTDGEGDVEGQDEAKDVLGIVNTSDVDGGFAGAGVSNIRGLEQIFAVYVTEFELRRFCFL